MKIKLQIYILGKVMTIEGLLMLLPVLCGLIYGELRNSVIYALFAIGYIAAGLLVPLKKPGLRSGRDPKNTGQAKTPHQPNKETCC